MSRAFLFGRTRSDWVVFSTVVAVVKNTGTCDRDLFQEALHMNQARTTGHLIPV